MTTPATAVVAGRLSDFREGEPRLVSTGKGQLAVVVWRGDVYAFRSLCPHQQGPISQGRVRLPLTSESAGGIGLDDRPVVVCPWHRWEYDLDSGQSIRRSGYRIRTHQAWVDGDMVMVDTRARRTPARRPDDGARP